MISPRPVVSCTKTSPIFPIVIKCPTKVFAKDLDGLRGHIHRVQACQMSWEAVGEDLRQWGLSEIAVPSSIQNFYVCIIGKHPGIYVS